MEELQTKTLDIAISGKTISCQIKERDFGDLIVFDVFGDEQYLFTLTQKGDVLFKIDPVPFEIQVRAAESNLANLKAKLITAEANTRNLDEQLNAATANVQSMDARVALSRMRVQQFRKAGAGLHSGRITSF